MLARESGRNPHQTDSATSPRQADHWKEVLTRACQIQDRRLYDDGTVFYVMRRPDESVLVRLFDDRGSALKNLVFQEGVAQEGVAFTGGQDIPLSPEGDSKVFADALAEIEKVVNAT